MKTPRVYIHWDIDEEKGQDFPKGEDFSTENPPTLPEKRRNKERLDPKDLENSSPPQSSVPL